MNMDNRAGSLAFSRPSLAVPVERALVPEPFTAPVRSGRLGLEVADFGRGEVLDGDTAGLTRLYDDLVGGSPGKLSVHGPFLDLNPISPEPGLRSLTRSRYLQAIEAAARLGADHVVFHTQFHPVLRMPGYPRRWVEESAAFWSDLVPVLRRARLTAVLENMWDPCPDFLVELLDLVGSPHLRACLDTGHVNLFSRVPLPGWVAALDRRLTYVHLSDNHGGWDEHLAVGDGVIDFVPFFDALAGRGLNPRFIIEVETGEKVDRSLEALGWRDLVG